MKMGNWFSEQAELDRFVKSLEGGPDLRVNKNIVMFCGLSSSDNLKQHYEKRKMEVGDYGADWLKALVDKLSALKCAPELAGLGGLAIAIFIDIISSTLPEESTKEALRSVFAEEKASEVWDLIDECLKRCVMNLQNPDDLKSDIRRIEQQLSVAITKLKNSMVRDGHMSSSALKAWVNGAAFHVQMLIHLVRLGNLQTCDPVQKLLSVYEDDVDPLFKKHQEMVKNKCTSGFINELSNVLINTNTRTPSSLFRFMEDEESNIHFIKSYIRYDKYVEVYYNHRFMKQKPDIDRYFRQIRENLQALVHQTDSLKI